MSMYLFRNFALLDPVKGALETGYEVLVDGKTIAEVAKGRIAAGQADVVDLGGRTLMPGLIDCHNHISPLILPGPPPMLPSLITARASDVLRGMVMRGFTTLRDAAGADLGHKKAVDIGYFTGPRLFISGRALSQTGGHADHRVQSDMTEPYRPVHLSGGIGRVADGVDEVRRAVRDEIRLGADQIKIMASGGIASASDPIDQLQYSMDEIRAAVEEASRSHTYVMAHAYPDPAIRRCVEGGVRTIEHGNMLSADTAKLMAKAGAYLVPTLTAFKSIDRHGRTAGYTEDQMKKNEEVLSAGGKALEYAKAAGVKVAYGTDIALWHHYQSEEFLTRAEVVPAADVIRSATVIGAEVLRMEGRLGVVKAGAFADLITIDGNPLDDLKLFQEQGKFMPFIMANGRVVKDKLGGRANPG